MEWFRQKNAQEPATQGGVIDVTAPMLTRRDYTIQGD